MFDALVQDLDSRLDLGGKASALVRTVLAHIFQTEPGGLSGLLDRFRKVGRGDLVSSWVGNPAPREVTWSQLEGTLGDSVLRQLADKAGVSVAQARPAVALLLPRVVGLLTADGRVPSTMPASVSAWIGKTGSVVGTYRDEPAAATVGTYREAAGATTVGTYREPAGATVGTYREPVPAPAIPARRIWSWLLPLAGLGVIGLIWALWPTTREVSPPAISQQPPTVSPRVSSAPPTPPPVATPPAPAVTAPAAASHHSGPGSHRAGPGSPRGPRRPRAVAPQSLLRDGFAGDQAGRFGAHQACSRLPSSKSGDGGRHHRLRGQDRADGEKPRALRRTREGRSERSRRGRGPGVPDERLEAAQGHRQWT